MRRSTLRARGNEKRAVVERLMVLLLLAVIAVIVALLLQRRRPDPPSAPSYRAPRQLDRADFRHPELPVLVVVFASTTCSSCPKVWADVEACGGSTVSAQYVTVQDDPGLHKRYRIDGVPTTIVADREGVVVHAFFGPVDPDELLTSIEAAHGR